MIILESDPGAPYFGQRTEFVVLGGRHSVAESMGRSRGRLCDTRVPLTLRTSCELRKTVLPADKRHLPRRPPDA